MRAIGSSTQPGRARAPLRGDRPTAFLCAVATIIALGALAGCATSAPISTPPAVTTTHSATPTTESESMTAITIEFDGREVHGTLADNATARSLLAHLPLTLSFSDYGGQEKIASLPQSLSTDGAAAASDAPARTIGYYVPNQSLVLYYDDVGRFNGIVPIGTYDTAGDAIARPSEITATIQKAS